MTERIVYLDSSAIAKRYLAEEGTEAVDGVYRRAERRSLRIAFSMWNLGEVLGVAAKAQRLGWIPESRARTFVWAFLNETLKLRGLGNLRILAVRSDLLSRGVPLLFRHGLSQADALQIESCRDIRAEAFVCADERLLRAAKGEGLVSLDPVRDSSRIQAL